MSKHKEIEEEPKPTDMAESAWFISGLSHDDVTHENLRDLARAISSYVSYYYPSDICVHPSSIAKGPLTFCVICHQKSGMHKIINVHEQKVAILEDDAISEIISLAFCDWVDSLVSKGSIVGEGV